MSGALFSTSMTFLNLMLKEELEMFNHVRARGGDPTSQVRALRALGRIGKNAPNSPKMLSLAAAFLLSYIVGLARVRESLEDSGQVRPGFASLPLPPTTTSAQAHNQRAGFFLRTSRKLNL